MIANIIENVPFRESDTKTTRAGRRIFHVKSFPEYGPTNGK